MTTVVDIPHDWHPIPVGAGGFITGLDITADGTLVCRTDTYGAYVWNGEDYDSADGRWTQVISTDSMPSEDAAALLSGGAYELVIAPSNTQRFWLYWNGYVYKSDNRGTTFTKTAFVRTRADGANVNVQRLFGRKMAVDPLDEDVVYVGTQTVGLRRTLDGGDTWTLLTDVPLPATGAASASITGITNASTVTITYSGADVFSQGNKVRITGVSGATGANYITGQVTNINTGANTFQLQNTNSTSWGTYTSGGTAEVFDIELPGITGIIFDPNSSSVSGRTATLWAGSYGYGYYTSTDGGDTWSKPSGGPGSAIIHSDWNADGSALYCTAYLTSSTSKIWKRSGGSWTDITSGYGGSDPRSVACDPFAVGRVLFNGPGGGGRETSDGGTTWAATVSGASVLSESTGDVNWLENGYTESYKSNGSIRAHPTIQNRFLFAEGIGMWYADIAPNATTHSWHAFSKGIEQLIGWNIAHTPNDDLFVTSWDRPCFKIASFTEYPSTYMFPSVTEKFDTICNGIEYLASDPSFVTRAFYAQGSAYSSDGGDTWTNVTAPSGSSFTNGGGAGNLIPLSTTQFIWCQTNSQGVFWTDDAGVTWTRPTFAGVDSGEYGGFNYAYFLNRKALCADRVTAGTAYIVHNNEGLFRTTDYGENWTLRHSGSVTAFAGNNDKLKAAPGNAGHLWYTIGDQQNGPSGAFKRSTDGGANWSTIADVLEVKDFGFGAIAPGKTYPRIWIWGWVNLDPGLYYSDDEGVSWVKTAFKPMGTCDNIQSIDGDKLDHNRAYAGMGSFGWAYTDGPTAQTVTGKCFGLQF